MKVSCLICAHSQTSENDQSLLWAIRSVVKQSRPIDELVLVLDECHSETKGYIESCQSANDNCVNSFIILEKNHKEGLAAAKNFGLEHITGDWLTFCDADDEWLPCKLEIQLKYLENHPDIDFLFTEAWDRCQDGVIRPNCFSVGQYETYKQIASALPYQNVLCHGSAMIRTQALRNLGGYSTSRSILGKEDWEVWRKALLVGYKFGKVPERLYIWSHGTSVER